MTLWLKGHSGSGKSTLAFRLEKNLLAAHTAAFALDGDNNRWPTRDGWNSDPEARSYADQLTKTVCDNIKTMTEIKIYVVAMTIPTSSTLDMLKDCASDPTMFFKADTAGQLKTAFTNIGRLVSSNSLIK